LLDDKQRANVFTPTPLPARLEFATREVSCRFVYGPYCHLNPPNIRSSRGHTTTYIHKHHLVMASYGYSAPHYHQNVSSHPHNHHGRSRRGPRISSQNAHRHYKAQRSPKEVPETPTYNEYLQKLEAAKSFDFEDDEVFCPFHLLSEDDVRSCHRASSRACPQIVQSILTNAHSFKLSTHRLPPTEGRYLLAHQTIRLYSTKYSLHLHSSSRAHRIRTMVTSSTINSR